MIDLFRVCSYSIGMANSVQFLNALLVLPSGIRKGCLLIEDGKIVSISDAPESESIPRVDCKENYLSPGFIDMHTHGGGGSDFMDTAEDSIIKACRMHLSHGTTSISPTTLTCKNEVLYKFFDSYRKAMTVTEQMPNLLGVHIEGPFFNSKQCGAQSPDLMQLPVRENYLPILDRGAGIIRRVSAACELEGALGLGDECIRRGILAAIGHSDATSADVEKAIDHGYSLVTHLYSGMSGLTRVDGYRVLGLIESAFLYDELDVEIIADGCHLPSELLKLIVKLKDNSKIALITDSMRAAGLKPGRSVLGRLEDGLEVEVEGGVARLLDKSGFAGSVATADRLVRTMVQQAGLSIDQAVRMASANPARILGLKKKGSLTRGFDADLLIFDTDINIHDVYVCGKKITGGMTK